jgi:peptide/nickel transport system substrate-binding protein
MEKKGQIAVGLIAIIAIAAIGGGIAFVIMTPPAEKNTLVYGTMYGPIDLDPQYAWDSASIDVIDQVTEGLFAYNLTDPDLAIIPQLASSGTWNPAATEFTVILRQGITFHDGEPFNADAVNFTWTRMNWAINTTGQNTVEVTQVECLYVFPDGTPIVSSITKNSDYNITFNLAGPFIPFQALLCFSGSNMLSPNTPTGAYIDTATGDLIGTGPFVYDGWEAGVEVTFHRNANYWKTPAKLDKLVFSVITDANARNAALLSGDIDYLSDPMDSILGVFNLTVGIDLVYVGKSLVTQYLGMNNVLINTTWREAIAYAVDYDYITDVLREGNAVKMESPIPEGITYANWTFDEAFLNVSYARELMQSMGFGVGWNVTVGSINELDWEGATFATFNYTYDIGNSFREDVLVLLQDNLGEIGIVVEDAGMSWSEIRYRLYEKDGRHRNMLQLYWISWGPDYNDPSNFINPLFTNRSIAFNGAQYNGYEAAIEAGRNPLLLNDNVQLLMEVGLSETDPVAREALYDRIQELLIEEDHPWVWGYISKLHRAWVANLEGMPVNAMGKEYFYPCYFS